MPRLDRLNVRGFKSIRALEDFELKSLNVLIGPNGAGKSNFIDLFRLLDQIPAQRLQVFVAEHGGPDVLMFGGRKRTDCIAMELFFGNNAYMFALLPANNRMVFLKEITLSGEAGRHSLGSGHYESNLGEADERGGDILEPYVGTASAAWSAYHFVDTSSAARVRQAQAIRDNLSLHTDAGNL